MHFMIWAAIGPALLQGVADMDDVCNAVSEILDSIFNATLPRNYHVKNLIEKELQFYPTASRAYEKTVRRGRAMLTPPDPMNETEFNDFVQTSICSLGIHTHDKSITGICHKPPKGINQCALTKPSGLMDKSKPLQIIDLTKPQAMTSEKVTISYEVSDKIQNRQSAIDDLPMTQQVGPLFRNNDPRSIVY